jgi:hypothetical protein
VLTRVRFLIPDSTFVLYFEQQHCAFRSFFRRTSFSQSAKVHASSWTIILNPFKGYLRVSHGGNVALSWLWW